GTGTAHGSVRATRQLPCKSSLVRNQCCRRANPKPQTPAPGAGDARLLIVRQVPYFGEPRHNVPPLVTTHTRHTCGILTRAIMGSPTPTSCHARSETATWTSYASVKH